MISYEEAKSKAAQYFLDNEDKPLASALETDGFWIFFGGNEDEIEFGGEGIIINRLSGEVSEFFLPDEENFELLDKAEKIEL